MRLLRAFSLVLLLACLSARALGAAPTAEAMRLLKAQCFSCHNEEKKKGGLLMTSREGMLKGGEGGTALVPGKPEESEIIRSLEEGADPHMPPKKQLSAAQMAALSAWVKEGAPWDAAALAAAAEVAPRPVKLAPLPSSYRPVLAVALSPDGTKLAAGLGHELVVFTVAETGLTPLSRASAHPDAVQSVAWSADGTRLATGAFRRVMVWKVEGLSVEREITAGLTDRITALRFVGERLLLADGRLTESGIVRVVETQTGALLSSWPAHADTIFALAASADGKLLATAGGDKLVKVWDLATQKETARLEGHTAQVLSVAFDAKGEQLVSGGADQQLKVWDVKTREKINELGKHTSAVNALAWAPEAPAVFAVTAGGAALSYTELSAHTGGQQSASGKERKLERVEGTLCCVAASAKGDRVFAGSEEGRIFMWNKQGKLVAKVEPGAPLATVTAAAPAK